MSSATNFNREMFAAEHQMIEDVIAATDIKSRRNFGNKIKELTANELQTCYGKYADASNVHPFWRTTITVNDEPEKAAHTVRASESRTFEHTIDMPSDQACGCGL